MKVSLLKCNQYDLTLVKETVKKALELIDAFNKIKPNDRIFIKLNCVGPFDKDMGITTHPIFVQAVIQLIKEKTNNITVGDNPATKDLIYTLKKNGIYEVLVSENVKILNGKDLTTISANNPKMFSTFEVSKEMVDADVLINLPKLKTHALAYMTVAQKNLFGFIYGLSKAAWHVRASNPLQFGEAFNDLYSAILKAYENKVMIHLCDGILGLEGEGPSSGGKPKQANVILASLDAISLDRVAVELVHLDHSKLFMNTIANERGLGVGNIDDIQIVGEPLSNFNLHFEAPKNALNIFGMRLLKIKSLRNLILEHPKIDFNKCLKCGECAHICPPKAMTIAPKNFPHLATNNCIRCWCCAEVCPQNAISKTKRPLIGRIVLKNRL